jgi:gamma-glutamyltranspeptidase
VIVLKDGKLSFVFGSPGGETIGQTEFQMLVNLIDFKLPVQQGDRSAALLARRGSEFLQARCRDRSVDREPDAAEDARQR